MESKKLKIKVISIGGAGTNMINRIIETTNDESIDYITISTNREELNQSNSKSKLLIGEKVTKGLGTYCNVDIGVKAFKESEKEIKEFLQKELENVNIVFLVTGLGGGTGTIVTPLISKMIKEMGIVTISCVSVPFLFEGKKKREISRKGKDELSENTDLLLISNPNNLNNQILEIVRSLIQTFKDLDDSVRHDFQEIVNYFYIHSDEIEDLSYDYLMDFIRKRFI